MDGIAYLLLFAAIAASLIAWRRTASFDARLRDMNLRLAAVQSELARFKGVDAPADARKEAEPKEERSPAEVFLEQAAPAEAPAEAPAARSSKAWGGKSAAIAEPAPLPEPEAVLAEKPAAPKADVEQALASKWFVWIGGAAIAMGGLLFIKYAHDNGLLPPAFRIVVGLVFGAVLVAAAEFLRRRSVGGETYIPAALSAGGLITAFGSIFAAYSLYDLVSPQTAFIGLALVALCAIALSLLQGPLIAALGLLGAYVVPTLISTDDPSALTFFPYVIIVLAACLAILRKRDWWWLGFGAIGGALVWVVLWIAGGVFEMADTLPVGLASLAIGALGALTARRARAPLALPLVGLAAGMIGLIALVGQTNHADPALTMLLIGGLGVVAFGALKTEADFAAPAAALAVFAAILLWRDASFFTLAMDESGLWQSAAGPGQRAYFFWMVLAGGLFGLAGLMFTRRLPRPWIWAGLAAGSLGLFGFGAWARVPEIVKDHVWIGGALGVIAALLLCILFLKRRVEEPDANLAMGLLATGATLAAIFALDRTFDRVWLTLAISALVPALAFAFRALPVKLLGPLATAVAALAAVKLFTAHDLWFGQGGLPLGDHWVLYGYGVPATLFLISSRLFVGGARAALEGGALALAVSLVSLELRILIGGGVKNDDPGLLEMSAHAMAWLGAAFGLLYRQSFFSSAISKWGARILIAASLALIIAVNLGLLNPVNTELPLAGGAVFNALLLAYLAPALLLALCIPRLGAIGWAQLRVPFGILILALLLAYLTLETKRLFQGPMMVIEPLTVAENYAYSAVWLVFALVLLIGGLKFNRQYIRFGGLAVMILVVLKVFLWDLSDLDGLYRIASFVGLGLCLVGIGFLYTKFAQRPGEAVPSAA